MKADTAKNFGPAFKTNWYARAGWLAAFLYAAYEANYLDVSWIRFLRGLGNGAEFLAEMVPPNFSRWQLLVENLMETVEIAIIALFMLSEFISTRIKKVFQ